MKFCLTCDSRLVPHTHTSNLVFSCPNCLSKFDAEPNDTLRSTVDYRAAESTEKYAVMKATAAFDVAGKKVLIACSACPMPYMTHIYVGEGYVSTYVCECGFETTGSAIAASTAGN